MLKIAVFITALVFTILAVACGGQSASQGKTIKSGPAGNLTVTLSSPDGVLRTGKQNFTITFADAAGKPVDVGSKSVNFYMPAMGSMAAMNDPAALTTAATPGVCLGLVELQMAGEWQAQIASDGPAGKVRATIPVTAQK